MLTIRDGSLHFQVPFSRPPLARKISPGIFLHFVPLLNMRQAVAVPTVFSTPDSSSSSQGSSLSFIPLGERVARSSLGEKEKRGPPSLSPSLPLCSAPFWPLSAGSCLAITAGVVSPFQSESRAVSLRRLFFFLSFLSFSFPFLRLSLPWPVPNSRPALARPRPRRRRRRRKRMRDKKEKKG